MLAASNHPQNASSYSCVFQQWHPCRLSCNCLSDSYILWRGMVKPIPLSKFNTWWTVVI